MPIKRQVPMSQSGQGGFTLVELMVVVAVIAVLAVIAAPGMTALINNSRVTSQTEELVTSLQLARAEAVRRNARVTVCPTDGSYAISTDCAGSASWVSWAAINRSETIVLEDRILRNSTANTSVQVTGPVAGIVFKPSGLIDTSQQLEITKSGNTRCLTVLVSGSVSTTKVAC